MFKNAKFELLRTFSKKFYFIFIPFTFISIVFLFLRIEDIKIFEKEKNNFLEREQAKVKGYNNYEQYGAYGCRILIEPTKLILFSPIQNTNTTSNIDTKEIINIYKNERGRNAFKKMSNRFYEFYHIIGSLFYLLFGWSAIRSEEFLSLLKSQKRLYQIIFLRIFFVIFVTILLDISMIIILSAKGLKLSVTEFKIYTFYILAHIIVSSIFCTLGFLARKWPIFKSSLLTCLFFWVALSFGVSLGIDYYIENIAKTVEDIEVVNAIKEKNTMQFEKESEKRLRLMKKNDRNATLREMNELALKFINNGHKYNNIIDEKITDEEKGVIIKKENIQILFPTTFLESISTEMSGLGDRGRLEFLKYVKIKREKFLNFYRIKKYVEDKKEIEPFFKKNENVFLSTPVLIKHYLKGIILHVLILFILIGLTLFLFREKPVNVNIQNYISLNNYQRRQLYFIFCPGLPLEKIYIYLRSIDNTLGIFNLSKEDFEEFDNLLKLFLYACNLYSSDINKASDNLVILGIDDIIKNEISDENVQKVFIGAAFASNYNSILMKKTLKGRSKTFERQFLRLISHHIGVKRVLYLDSELYEVSNYPETKAKSIQIIPIEKMEVSFR
jgi:hypothetical protein